ncbi:hypothetical protein CBL_20887, partial [Carabus blaptoides fortunei]
GGMESKSTLTRRVAVSFTGDPPPDPKFLTSHYTVQKSTPTTSQSNLTPTQQSTSAEISTVAVSDGYQRPMKRHCASPVKDAVPPTIEVSNSFTALSSDVNENVSNNEDAMEQEQSQDAKKRSPPPIFLRSKINYQRVAVKARRNNITFTKVQNRAEDIKFQPATEDDYRKFVRQLEDDKEPEPFHTFELSSEKSLKVVIRGLPETISEDDVTSELTSLGYPVRKVRRLSVRGKTIPLVSVDLERSDKGKDIFRLGHLFYLVVKVESKRRNNAVTQCFRCQKFGHVSKCCRAKWKCVRCGDDHATKRPRKPTQSQIQESKPNIPVTSRPANKVTSTKSFTSAVTGIPAPTAAPPAAGIPAAATNAPKLT